VYWQDGDSYQLENTVPASARSYVPAHTGRHMIRVVTLQQGSGTYFSASQGVFWDVTSISSPGTGNPNLPPPPLPTPPVGPGSRLVNLSSRLRIASGDASRGAIAGFVVKGAARPLLIRAVGPTLSGVGIGSPLANPNLEVLDASGRSLASNAGWNNDGRIADAAAIAGAFRLNDGSADAALLLTLPAGSYTAQVRSGGSGTALVEVYDVASDPSSTGPQLINLSTRGTVGTGDNVIVAGFIVSGSDSKRVLIRAVGPGLANYGVGGTLSDPMLTLFDSRNTILARNDNWESPIASEALTMANSPSDIVAAGASVQAFNLQSGSRDAALLVTLPPGGYTASVSGVNGATGVALVEVYEVP
jgi:hypothetical protein